MAEVTPRPATGAAAPARVFDHAVQVRPYGNLRVSGDVGVVIEQDAGVFVAMVDVLGHGHVAATTARRIDSLLRTPGLPLRDVAAVLTTLHAALKGKLGCAAGLAWCDRATGRVTYTAVGNTVARCFTGAGKEKRLLSRDGTLGDTIPSPREEQITLGPADALIFYTDGLSDRFNLIDYPLLKGDSAATVARTLVEKFGKTHDDASAICLRYAR